MTSLNVEKMEQIEGGCGCSGAGICCEHWNLGRWGDWAVCFGCDGTFQYAEPW